MIFVIYHGAFGNSNESWFPYLKNNLEKVGETVLVPQFPVDDWNDISRMKPQEAVSKNQNLTNWISTFEQIITTLPKEEKLCFIGHSVGCVFILHALEKFGIQLDSAIFVCPFLKQLGRHWQVDLANKTFYKSDFNFERLRTLIPLSYVLYSDNDPYVDEKHSLEFGEKLGSQMIMVRGGKHLNGEAGLYKFPLLLELCKTRLEDITSR